MDYRLSSIATLLSLVTLCLSEYVVLHTPSSVHLRSTDNAIANSDIPRVISSTLGFTLDKDLSWDGLYEKSLFDRPQANVVISLPGYKSEKPATSMGTSFKTSLDTPAISYDPVTYKMRRHIAKPTIVDFALDNGMMDIRSQTPEIFSNVRPVEGNNLHKEVQAVHQIVKSLQDNNKVVVDSHPDFFHFSMSNLAATSDPAQIDAFLSDTVDSFRRLYADNVMVHLVALPAATEHNVRKARSLLEDNVEKKDEEPESPAVKYNFASAYTDDFPIMFNIILWTMVVLIITVSAIAYGTWNMDPGRDSIIYRMTTQRLKSD